MPVMSNNAKEVSAPYKKNRWASSTESSDQIKTKKNVRAPGVEPGALAWEAKMLPLHHARDEITVILALR